MDAPGSRKGSAGADRTRVSDGWVFTGVFVLLLALFGGLSNYRRRVRRR
jgi:hypothetical protein